MKRTKEDKTPLREQGQERLSRRTAKSKGAGQRHPKMTAVCSFGGSAEGSQPFARGSRGMQSPLGGVQRRQSLGRVQGGSAYSGVQRVKPFGPCRIDACVNPYWVLPDALRVSGAGGLAAFFCDTILKGKEENGLKLTRHNGRSGKNGTYNPRHNDRRFDVENSEHIAAERVVQNIYWDCYRGVTTMQTRADGDTPDFSFEQIEHAYYLEHYGDHVDAQNARNEQRRHSERNRTIDDLLKNNKTCPEETIYQIGTIEESTSPETLVLVVGEFYEEFEKRFGSHVHILDWALHLDEGTPHIHERHVFDCENRYGELCPQQEKALEALGIPLPNPDKPKGRNNNRKQTFDAICRELLFEIAQKHGLHLDHEPEYGGREYLEKQDYILAKQKEQIAQKEQEFAELTLKVEEVETLIDEVSEVAYDKAVEVVTDTVRAQTQAADLSEIEGYRKWANAPERKHSDATKNVINKCLDAVTSRLKRMAAKITEKIQTALQSPAARAANKAKVKEKARESITAMLEQKKAESAQRDAERRAAQPTKRDAER